MLLFVEFVTNTIGQTNTFFSDKMLHWGGRTNPIILIIIYSLFGIFKNLKIDNRYINNISSLSLLIYLVHENLLFRTYIRPYYYLIIYENFCYGIISVWSIVLAIVMFVVSLIISIFLKFILDRLFLIIQKLILSKLLILNCEKIKFLKEWEKENGE